MRLYKEDLEPIRVDVRGGKDNSGCVTVYDTTIDELKEYLISVFSKVERTVTIKATDRKVDSVTIVLYKAYPKDKKSKSKSLSVYGFSRSSDVIDIIKKSLSDDSN